MRNLKTVLFLFFAVMWTNTFAQTTFSLSQSEIACGEQTCLQVRVQGFTDIIAFQYSMNWDAAILGNAAVQSFGIGDLSTANFNLASPGIARIGWDDSNTTGVSLADNTIIFEICFDEIGGNTAASAVDFSDNPIAIEVIDAQGEIVTTNFNNGTVAVNCETMGDDGNTANSLTFSANQATANCGEQVCVDVSASGFQNILSFQYSMNWDASLLGTATVQNFGITDMDASQFNATTAGILRVGYDDSSLQGVNLVDNSVLFQVCFDLANDAVGTTDLTFSESPIAIEVTDAQGSIVTAAFQTGNVTVSCDSDNTGGDDGTGGDNTDDGNTGGDNTGGDNTGDSGGNASISDTLAFAVNQVTANCGEQICVDVTASGFADIVSFQYSMNWDAALLGTPTLQQFGLPDMDASQFNTATPGILRVGYDDSSLQGRSVADGTVLYQLCFDLAADVAGTSDLQFSANPIAIEVVDVQSNILTPVLQNGSIAITCEDSTMMDSIPPLPTLPLGFTMSADTSNCGEQVCLEVSVQGFIDITSFRYSTNWNAQLLGGNEIGATNLAGIRFGDLAPGVFFTEWIDFSGEGLTLPDNSIIYTVCFDQFTSTERNVPVSFTGVPIPVRVTESTSTRNLQPALNSGEIFIACNPIVIDTVINDIADSLTFAINNVTGNCEEQTCISVTTQDFNDIFSFQYSIAYNADLGAASVQNFGLEGMNENNFNLAEAGAVRVGWDDATLMGASLPDDQVLFDLCFDVAANIAGSFEVDFSSTPLAIEAVDVNGNILSPSLFGGALIIACEDAPPPPVDTMLTPETLQLSISDGVVNCGDQICVDVTAKAFNSILSFQYSILWNANVLGNASVQQFNLSGLGAGNFNAEAPGILRAGWTDLNITGVTMAEDAILYQICFDAIGEEAANTAIQFSNIPLAIEILDEDANPIEATLQNGNVSVNCTIIEPPLDTMPTNIGDELAFILSQTTGNCDNQVCLDVSVANFNDILTYQYSINWDASVLGQASVQGFNMPSLSAANFNTATPGIVRVGWDDAFITGVSLPDNQVIYQICFDNIDTAIENLPITFSGIPTSIEVVDDQNNLINPEFINGSLSVECDGGNNGNNGNNGEGTTEGDLTFKLSPITATCGEQICTDVQVSGFKDILSFQYSILWDAAALGTATIQSFGIPDINASNFNTNTAGILRVGWDDTFVTGVTLPDDRILFQVCFDPVEEGIDNINLDFSDTPTSIEVVDRNGQLVTPTFQNGSITVNCTTTEPVDADNDGFANDVDCDDNNAAINPNGIEIANNGIDENCDGVDLIENVTVDADNDGFANDVDCDDNNAAINPNGIEIANNGIDENCDGVDLIENVTVDADNDGFANDVDCDDNNAAINPNGIEIANNGIDENCDGVDLVTPTEFPDNDGDGFTSDVDCDDNNPIIYPGATEFPNNNVDEDCDGIAQFFDADNDGFNSSIDCDDNNPNINGRATEIPNNGIDEDCDGVDLVTNTEFPDNDGDGFTSDVDCDDNNPIIYPGATEFPNNNVDEDCDGIAQFFDADNDGFNSSIDCDDNNPNINGNATEIPNNGIDEDCDGADLVENTFIDADNDGFDSVVDCDDNNPNINTGATEIPNNGIDEDCNGSDLIENVAVDADNDGFDSDSDCDDNNPNINPNATEIANNGIDEDCNGADLIENVAVDADNDGFNSDSDCDDNNPNINPNATEIPNNGIDEDCNGADLIQNVAVDADNDGFNSDSDCDDNNPNINPGATEIPNNGIDEDCNGADLIQNVAVDADNDGFNSDSDCDDNNPNINPGATEIANNGIDEDCNGADLIQNVAVDADNDGFNSESDCDDNNPNINPNATEIANNGIDEDCNGSDLIQNVAIDADNDGFDSDSDCDDNNPNINPSATEIPNNGIDEDCNGADLIENIAVDADNDGFDSDSDCDDNNPNINPAATEIPNNGIDEDCNGADLIEVDPNAVTIQLADATATCGEQICLDAIVGNFTDLISFQYSLNWDTTVLTNVSTQSYMLEGLNNSAFFTPQNGMMRVSWFDTQVRGVSAADDQVIFQICFDVVSNGSTTTTVQFSNSPIPVEVIDKESNEVATNFVDGEVSITNCANIIMGETNTPTIAADTENPNNLPPSSILFNKAKNGLGNVQLYPNPTTNYLNLILENSLQQNGEIRLYNIWGKLLQTTPIEKGLEQTQLSLGNFASGVYLIEVQEGNTFVRKRVIRQ